MEELTQRVVQLEKDTHQIRVDVATLTERSKNFATTASVDALTKRCDTFVTKAEFNGKLHDFEVRLNKRLDRMDSRMNARYERMESRMNAQCERMESRMDERTDRMHGEQMAMIDRLDARIITTESRTHSIDSKIFWGIFLPGMTAAIGWFIRTAVMV